MKTKQSVQLLWMYPDLMSTYGDRGNVICLRRRCAWRGIGVEVVRHTIGDSVKQIKAADIIFMGGAQDRQQVLVAKDIKGVKGLALHKKIDAGAPGLYICGAYQFLGKYYKAADGTKIPGLGIFDIYTEHTGDQSKRLIGNIVIEPSSTLENNVYNNAHEQLVGFENHGGRTYLGQEVEPFGTVIVGSGNNGEDGTEGMIYKNSVGTYLHGPILPKNPELADSLIGSALRRKYGKDTKLQVLDDKVEKNARASILQRLGI